jgi:hypothetical protein
VRKKLKAANKSFSQFQKKYRKRKEVESDRKNKEMLEDELKFFLLLEHRRKQKQRKLDLMQLIEILPSLKIGAYFEKQKEDAAKKIQAFYRGYRERKMFQSKRESLIQRKAAIVIQQAVIIIILSFVF